ncbi:MAG: cytochrome c [Acidobacteria bacterium]|nr:MAG: cytochrome c [Acidobacteriota bacterium]
MSRTFPRSSEKTRRIRTLAVAIVGSLYAALPVAALETPDYGDIAPILARHCASCHQPGDIAPMTLGSYEEVRPWARAIARKVAAREMPPWFADPEVGSFRNDARLEPSEIDRLVEWARAGAPRGEGPDSASVTVPPAPPDDRWRLGTPDLVVEMPEAFPVPAEGVVDYVYVRLPSGLAEPRWIRAIEVQPGAREVVHHIDVLACSAGCPEDEDFAALEPGELSFLPGSPITERPRPRTDAGIDGDDIEFLTSFLPGGVPQELPDGHARLLPAGADLVLNLHYTPSGTAVHDRSRVGLWFADAAPRQRVVSMFLDNFSIWIPAGEASHRVTTRATLAQEARLLALTPHMHSRGRSAEVYLEPAEASAPRALLKVPRYDFNWQITYELAEPLALQAGDTIRYELSWDNSEQNPHNPDPSRDVPWGRQTSDEMASVFVTLAVPPEVEPSELFE